MRVLLINPPPTKRAFIKEGRCQTRAGPELWPPVTLGVIASLLKKEDFNVTFLDATASKISFNELEQFFYRKQFDVVVINSTTTSFFDDLKVAEIVKKISSETKTIFYGTHVTALPEAALKYNCIDFVIRKEPEFTTLNLLKTLRSGKKLKLIKGISYKESKKIINNQDAEFIFNLDELPFADLSLFPNERYLLPQNNEKFILIRTSRGCPFQCIYCTSRLYYGCKWRTRSYNNVLDEVDCIIKKYKIKNFLFNSETFNLDKKWLYDFCNEIIKRNLDIKWMCNSRVDTVDEKGLELMKKSGCWFIAFGIESGNQEILNNIKKNITLAQVEHAVKLVKNKGFEHSGSFMFGLPGETEQTMKRTINFAKKLNLTYARFYRATPFPGTEFYQMAEERGWLKSKDWALYDHADCNAYELDNLTSAEINKYIKKAYRQFYFRPGYILKQIRKTSLSNLRIKVFNGGRFLKEWLT